MSDCIKELNESPCIYLYKQGDAWDPEDCCYQWHLYPLSHPHLASCSSTKTVTWHTLDWILWKKCVACIELGVCAGPLLMLASAVTVQACSGTVPTSGTVIIFSWKQLQNTSVSGAQWNIVSWGAKKKVVQKSKCSQWFVSCQLM